VSSSMPDESRTRRFRLEVDVGVERDAVVRHPAAQMTGPQVEHSVRDTQRHGVTVPVVAGVGDGRLRPRLQQHRVEPIAVLALDREASLLPSLLKVLDPECILIGASGLTPHPSG
jgi:uncharacterized protein YgbK (DUF1537 family)